MLQVILVMHVVPDVREILLTLVLSTLQQVLYLFFLGFVLAQDVHCLRKFEVDLVLSSTAAQLGNLRVDLQGVYLIFRRLQS
jgi:hypothetical protein